METTRVIDIHYCITLRDFIFILSLYVRLIVLMVAFFLARVDLISTNIALEHINGPFLEM